MEKDSIQVYELRCHTCGRALQEGIDSYYSVNIIKYDGAFVIVYDGTRYICDGCAWTINKLTRIREKCSQPKV